MILVISPESAASEWVKAETAWALANLPGKLIPILLRETPSTDMHVRLPLLQHIDFRGRSTKAREDLIKYLVTREYAPESQENLLRGLIRCPAKEVLTVVRVEIDRNSNHTHTIVDANHLAEEFYGRRKGLRLRGTPLLKLFEETLQRWMDEVDYQQFVADQKRMMEALSRGEEIAARTPMRLNHQHPSKIFRGGQYFPIVIAYSNPVQRDRTTIHEGLVCYVDLTQLPTVTTQDNNSLPDGMRTAPNRE
jgi:hypothetical protein